MTRADSDCGLDRALRVIAGKWKPTIIWVLHERPLHFGELLRSLPGISEKVLTEQLRGLEEDGVVTRSVHPGRVIRVLYELSPAGRLLNDAVHALSQWGLAQGSPETPAASKPAGAEGPAVAASTAR
jgi:DNA-binding HxlR family transcriptional regulator